MASSTAKGWTRIPNELLEAGVSPNALAVFCALARRADNETGMVQASLSDIAGQSKVGLSTLKRLLSAGELNGWVQLVRRGDISGRANEWYVALPKTTPPKPSESLVPERAYRLAQNGPTPKPRTGLPLSPERATGSQPTAGLELRPERATPKDWRKTGETGNQHSHAQERVREGGLPSVDVAHEEAWTLWVELGLDKRAAVKGRQGRLSSDAIAGVAAALQHFASAHPDHCPKTLLLDAIRHYSTTSGPKQSFSNWIMDDDRVQPSLSGKGANTVKGRGWGDYTPPSAAKTWSPSDLAKLEKELDELEC